MGRLSFGKGVNPSDPSDHIDLREGYHENAKSSAPTFYYILEDITVVEQCDFFEKRIDAIAEKSPLNPPLGLQYNISFS